MACETNKKLFLSLNVSYKADSALPVSTQSLFKKKYNFLLCKHIMFSAPFCAVATFINEAWVLSCKPVKHIYTHFPFYPFISLRTFLPDSDETNTDTHAHVHTVWCNPFN